MPKSTQDSKDYGEIKLASDTVLGIPSQVKRLNEVFSEVTRVFCPSVVVVVLLYTATASRQRFCAGL